MEEVIHMTSEVSAWILCADNSSQMKVLDSVWSMKRGCSSLRTSKSTDVGRVSAAKVPREGN